MAGLVPLLSCPGVTGEAAAGVGGLALWRARGGGHGVLFFLLLSFLMARHRREKNVGHEKPSQEEDRRRRRCGIACVALRAVNSQLIWMRPFSGLQFLGGRVWVLLAFGFCRLGLIGFGFCSLSDVASLAWHRSGFGGVLGSVA